MYTGGTTGLPKGVLLDQRAEMLNMYHVTVRLPMSHHDVSLLQTPMFREIIEHCREQGGGYKMPKQDLRATYWEGRARLVN